MSITELQQERRTDGLPRVLEPHPPANITTIALRDLRRWIFPSSTVNPTRWCSSTGSSPIFTSSASLRRKKSGWPPTIWRMSPYCSSSRALLIGGASRTCDLVLPCNQICWGTGSMPPHGIGGRLLGPLTGPAAARQPAHGGTTRPTLHRQPPAAAQPRRRNTQPTDVVGRHEPHQEARTPGESGNCCRPPAVCRPGDYARTTWPSDNSRGRRSGTARRRLRRVPPCQKAIPS